MLRYHLHLVDDAVVLIETGGVHRADIKILYQDDNGIAYALVMHRSTVPNLTGKADHPYNDTEWEWGTREMSSLTQPLAGELQADLIEDGVDAQFATSVVGLLLGFGFMIGAIPLTDEAIARLRARIAGNTHP